MSQIYALKRRFHQFIFCYFKFYWKILNIRYAVYIDTFASLQTLKENSIKSCKIFNERLDAMMPLISIFSQHIFDVVHEYASVVIIINNHVFMLYWPLYMTFVNRHIAYSDPCHSDLRFLSAKFTFDGRKPPSSFIGLSLYLERQLWQVIT